MTTDSDTLIHLSRTVTISRVRHPILFKLHGMERLKLNDLGLWVTVRSEDVYVGATPDEAERDLRRRKEQAR